MVKRPTWILLVVFAAFIGLAFLWTRVQEDRRKANPTPTATPQQQLFTIDSAAVASFKITDNASGKSVMIARDVNGQWALVDPKADYTDVASVEAAITQLSSLQVLTVLDATDNLADFGLDEPAYTISVNINGGQQYLAQIGNTTATSNGYYVLVPGGVPQIIAKYGLDAVLKMLQNPPVATPTATPTQTGTIVSTAEMTSTLEAPSSTPTPTDTPMLTFTATVTPVPMTPTLTAVPTSLEASPTKTSTP
jgi:hypothetical protein